MSKLKTYKFSQLYSMSSGISSKPEQSGHGNPFLSFSTVFNNYFLPDSLNDLMDTSEIEQETYSILKGDIFLTRTSEVIDELGMSSVVLKDYPKATYSGFLKRLRPTQTGVTYPKYMAFYLRSKLFRKTMTNNAVLTLRASLNENIFSYLDLILPEYNQQVKSGDLLYLINSKIKLNNRINAELESLAKTIYDYWFVQFDFPFDFAQGKPSTDGKPYKSSGGEMVYVEEGKSDREIPLGWKVKKLREFTNTASGGTPLSTKSEYYEKGNIAWINSGEVNNHYITEANNFITQAGLDNSSAKFFEPNTLLVAMYGATAGKVSLLQIHACTNQAICAIIPNSIIYNNFLKFALDDLYKHLINLSTGSARDNLSQDIIKNLKFTLPEENLLIRFNEAVNPIISKILINQRENQQLTQLRDWLLPMLMNGQVRIK